MAAQSTDELRVAYIYRYRNIIFGLIICITILNILHFGAGIALTATIDYALEGYYGRPSSWYTDNGAVAARVRLGFFYCTIPLVLSIVAIFSTIRISKSVLSRRFITLSASAAFALWAVQMALEGSCIWITNAQLSGKGGASHCPFAYRGWHPLTEGGVGFQSGGLVAAWIVPWFVAPLLVLYIAYFAVGWWVTRTVVVDVRLVPGRHWGEAPGKADEVVQFPRALDEKAPVTFDRTLSMYTTSTVQVPPESTTMSTKGVSNKGPPSYRASSLDSTSSAGLKV